jgi:hypothetical protein
MFSGITNQVSNLSSLFSKNADEQVPTPEEGGEQPQPAAAATSVAAVTEGVENINVDAGGEKQRYESEMRPKKLIHTHNFSSTHHIAALKK